MVEPQPSKLMMWVRFPSPAPYERCKLGELEEDRGPHSSGVEHFLGKEEVPVQIRVWAPALANEMEIESAVIACHGRANGKIDYKLNKQERTDVQREI